MIGKKLFNILLSIMCTLSVLVAPAKADEYDWDPNHYMVWTDAGGYWIEDGHVAGRYGDPYNIIDTIYGIERGREVYDPVSEDWYWLDALYGGRVAVSKEVWFPYVYSNEIPGSTQGKWVRYGRGGEMIKGFCFVRVPIYDIDGNFIKYAYHVYYYDEITGAMAKGTWTLYDNFSGKPLTVVLYFDPVSGICDLTDEAIEILRQFDSTAWYIYDVDRKESYSLQQALDEIDPPSKSDGD